MGDMDRGPAGDEMIQDPSFPVGTVFLTNVNAGLILSSSGGWRMVHWIGSSAIITMNKMNSIWTVWQLRAIATEIHEPAVTE